MSSDAYQLKEVRAHYGSRLALDVPELSVEAGQVTAVLGPNGSGKSTLLRVLAFLQDPTSGEVLFFGQPRIDRLRVGVVLQNPYIFHGSVRRNIELAGPADRVLDRFGLRALAERPARELSAGERMRVALARALAHEPEVLLFDECTTGLDSEHSAIVEELIREGKRTVVFATMHVTKTSNA